MAVKHIKMTSDPRFNPGNLFGQPCFLFLELTAVVVESIIHITKSPVHLHLQLIKLTANPLLQSLLQGERQGLKLDVQLGHGEVELLGSHHI